MKTLVIGGTGTVGSQVVRELLNRGADVKLLLRKQTDQTESRPNLEIAVGDLLDPSSISAAMSEVDKLFLLNALTAEELTQSLIALDFATRAKVKHITYLSVFRAEIFPDVPHFASKLAVEKAIRGSHVPFTFVRPGFYMQNDGTLKDAIVGAGVYPNPVGIAGIASVDVRDIGEAAAISLTQEGHEGKTYNLVSSSLLKGPEIAQLWGGLLNREVKYGGHDFDTWEVAMAKQIPGWMAFDMRMMYQGYFDRGFQPSEQDISVLTGVLGHPPRTYEAFAKETAASWLKSAN